MFHIPKVYAITDRELSGHSHAEQVRRFAAGGIKLIQLREKTLAAGEWIDDAFQAAKIAKELGVTLIVNDRIDIAIAIDADGVHLGQTDMPIDAARQLLGPKKIIGLSTHTREQAIGAKSEVVDYIAFGPIYSTNTKSDHDPVVGLDGLREIREIVGERLLVAIGGIDHSNANAVIAAGADSVAVISCLHNHSPSVEESCRELLLKVEQ
ncbi:MAG TPA: thiamine phosphate synthase [Pyrinomonadaceae bacterium]|nr:thiamine phosphate synthase [Pyrinomonadaceae bacterium]